VLPSVPPSVRVSVYTSIRPKLLFFRPSIRLLSNRLSVHTFVHLSVCSSIRLSAYTFIHLSVRPPICLSVLKIRLYFRPSTSVCPAICLSDYPSVHTFVHLSVCLSVCPYFRPSVCLSICLCEKSVCTSAHTSICLRLSVCLFVSPYFCPSVHSFVCLLLSQMCARKREWNVSENSFDPGPGACACACGGIENFLLPLITATVSKIVRHWPFWPSQIFAGKSAVWWGAPAMPANIRQNL
jgi:hypothetical protein